MIDVTRRSVIAGLAAVLTAPVSADSRWPNRPITLMHGFAPGGPVDTLSRILAEALSKRLGEEVIVDSKPGAAGTIAAGVVSRAAPDGYTLMAVPGTYVAAAALYKKLSYRPIEDFSMISTTAEYPFVLVTHSDNRIRKISDFIDLARSQTTPLQYGTSGIGSLQHLSMELFARMAKIQLQHIPYRGGAPAITDLLGKRLDFVIDAPTSLIDFVASGRLRAFAVTGPNRFFALPDVPSIAESGFSGYAVTAYQGIAAPANLPNSIVNRLNSEIAAVLIDLPIVQRMRALGNNPRPSSPEEFKMRLAHDIAQWSKVIAEANIERI